MGWGTVVNAFSPELGRQRWADIYKFKATLVYRTSSSTISQGYWKKLSQNSKTPKQIHLKVDWARGPFLIPSQFLSWDSWPPHSNSLRVKASCPWEETEGNHSPVGCCCLSRGTKSMCGKGEVGAHSWRHCSAVPGLQSRSPAWLSQCFLVSFCWVTVSAQV